MRSDITPGGTFPDYALPDHTDTVRTLGDLQGRDPMILTLPRGHYCPKEHQQHLELAQFQSKLGSATRAWSPSRPTITTRCRSSARPWVLSGRSSRTRDGLSRRTSTSRSTPTPNTIR